MSFVASVPLIPKYKRNGNLMDNDNKMNIPDDSDQLLCEWAGKEGRQVLLLLLPFVPSLNALMNFINQKIKQKKIGNGNENSITHSKASGAASE